jgi:hypothetical protein
MTGLERRMVPCSFFDMRSQPLSGNAADCLANHIRVYLMRFTFAVLFWVALVISAPAVASALDFPDLDLSSSLESVRSWAEEHQFKPVDPTAPYDEAFQLETKGEIPARRLLSVVADGHALKMLAFEQYGILTLPSILRREIVHRFGKPGSDQITGGKTLRITYPLAQPEAARRIFLIGDGQLSMLLVTDSFFARLKGETEEQERTEEAARQHAAEAARQAEHDARDAWLVLLGWAAGIAIGGFVLIRLLPLKLRKPVVRVLGWAFGGLINFGIEVFDQIFPIVMGILIFAMMIFSGLAVGSGAVEWGTSWWWALFWVSGFAMLLKADSEDSMNASRAFLTLGLFVAATAGVFIQHFWPIL